MSKLRPRPTPTPTRPHRRPSPRPRATARGPSVEALEARELLATFLVNTGGDGGDPTALSLREAIEVSNGTLAFGALSPAQQAQISGTLPGSAPNVLDFSLGGAGSLTISPKTPLPAITSPLIIDGYYNTGAATNPSAATTSDLASLVVRIDGSSVVTAAGQPSYGLEVHAANSVISGLMITGFRDAGVSISGPNAHGNWLWGDFIGTLPETTFGHDFSTAASLRNGTGVLVAASNNLVGGGDPGQRNVIDNNGVGVALGTHAGTGTLVEGNFLLDNLAQGVLVTSSNNTIGQETAGGGNVISGNGTDGILIDADLSPGGAQGNGIFNNSIGPDVSVGIAGLAGIRPRISPYQQLTGVRITDSPRNAIGGVLAAGRNVIAGNQLDGINIDGPLATGNRVLNNWIGFNLAGGGPPPYNGTPLSAVLSNLTYLPDRNGIAVTSPGNVIGGPDPGEGNTISNNRQNGILLFGPGASGNTVQGNVIGLTPAGLFATDIDIGNGLEGVKIDNAPNNVVGGDHTTNARNTISGNNDGVYLLGPGATGNVVEGNNIGTATDGVTDLGNAVDGVALDNAPGNTIGGSDTTTTVLTTNPFSGIPTSTLSSVTLGNVIAGNNLGVRVDGPGSTGDLVQGNYIGTDVTGRIVLHNETDGLLVTNGASGNTIGGYAQSAGGTTTVNGSQYSTITSVGPALVGNTISNNVGAGVDLDGTSGTNNVLLFNTIGNNNGAGVSLFDGRGTSVLSNSIYGNLGAGLSGPGYTGPGIFVANQVPAPNKVPLLAFATPGAASTYVGGSINDPAAPNTTFTVQFFSNPGPPVNGYGQGQTLVYTSQVTTDASGHALIAQVIPQAVTPGQWVTATATDAAGNTSAFSAASPTVPQGVQFSSPAFTVSESKGSATVTVTRTGYLNTTDTVNYAVGGGSAVAGVDYTTVSGTLVFQPGQAAATFPVPVIDAKKVGGSVTLNLTLSGPSGGVTLGNPSVSTLTILDDDPAAIRLGAASGAVNENAGFYTFTVLRNSPVGVATVQYATADGTALAGVNYTATAGTLTFNPGETTKTVSVPVIDDGVVTGPLKFTVALSNPVNGVFNSTTAAAVTVINTDVVGQPLVSYTIVVNTADDENNKGDGTISLREAIEISNGTLLYSDLTAAERALVTTSSVLPTTGNSPPVPNTIDFNLPGTGVQTIEVNPALGQLPTVTAPVLINGYTQAGSAVSTADKTEVDVNSALVRIDGAGDPGLLNGLTIDTSNCEVSGLIVTGFHEAGISIYGPNSHGNWLWGNFLGALPDPVAGKNFEVNPLDAAQLSRPQIGNQGEGLRIASSNNRVGGNTPGLPNVMANNGYDSTGGSALGVGILIETGGTGNLIQGNVVFNNAAQGVLVHSSNNTIGEALQGGGNVIGGNGAQGVEITDVTGGLNVQGNQLLGNFIGTDLGTPDGKVKKGTARFPNKAQGVLILNSPKNTIGGYTAAAGNVIGMNLLDGVEIDGAASTGNRLLNNFIGFNQIGGTIALLPNQNGVSVNGAGGNFVGDASGQGGNTIANNRNNGILLLGPGSSGNVIAGNLIGLNPGGASAFPNAFDGVHVENAPDNLVGGPTTPARNTISANNNGVYITGLGATGNVVQGNFIGTAVDGVTDLGNAVYGVVLDGAPFNTIGGPDTAGASAATLGNVISGNNVGVIVVHAGSHDNLIQGNFIGTDLTAKLVIANKVDGVLVSAGASNNSIGDTINGAAAGAGNTIAYNAGEGVNLVDGTGNAVLTNSIFSNNAPNGIALNPATRADKLQPAPALSASVPNGPSTSVQGTLDAAPDASYTLQFFASNARDRSGSGQGQTFLLAATVTTDAAGHAALNVNVPGVAPGQWVTATATDLVGNSSAFSNAVIGVPVSIRLGAASYTTTEGAGSIAIPVYRAGGSAGTVSVDFGVGGGTATPNVDVTPVSGTLYFNPGDPNPKYITVPILNAGKVGGSVSVNVTLSNPGNGASAGTPSSATLTIQDDAQPTVGFAPGATTFYGPGVASFVVTRNTPNGTATVRYATSDGLAAAGVNYVAASGTLTFNPGQTSQTIPVTILDDSLPHAAPLTFRLTLSRPTGVALGANSLQASDVTGNAPGAFQLNASSTFTAPGSAQAAVTVLRTGGKTGTVSVDYSTGTGTARPGVDYKPVSGTLVFQPGETSKVVYVPLLNTNAPGANKNFVLGLGNATGGAALGSLTLTTVTILHPPAAGGGGAASAPEVADILPVAGASGFRQVVISFSRAMDPGRASDPANYALTLNGRAVPIAKVGYDPAANHAVLFLGATVPFGAFARIDIRGLADTTGVLLDGSGTGHNPGSPFAALIGEGRQLVYTDRSGDTVGLNLAGAGLMALRRSLDGEAEALRFVNTTPNLSTLTGKVVPKPGTAGTTSIASISAAAGVRIRLASPPFYLGGITAAAVDALAVSGGLKAKQGY